MTWQCFRLAYEMRSPIHIGYHKVGSVQRTRYYIPARNLWGAVTERLTRSGFDPDDASTGKYQKIGKWVQEHCAFSYFLVCDDQDNLLFPHFTEKGVCYGELTQAKFERHYLGSHVTTALEAASTSVESGSLHEVEFIAPYDSEGQRTYLRGWVFLDGEGEKLLGTKEMWKGWLEEIQVGGERRYGFGRLRLAEDGWKEDERLKDYPIDLRGPRPKVYATSYSPLLAHTLANGVQARGQIEPLVGRETSQNSQLFGIGLTRAKICWVPGSLVLEDTPLQLEQEGCWTKVK